MTHENEHQTENLYNSLSVRARRCLLAPLRHSMLTLCLYATRPGAHAGPGHPGLIDDHAFLHPTTLPEPLSILAEPPASKLPRVRYERRSGGALTKMAKDPVFAAPADLLRWAEEGRCQWWW
jgi:hypothetical protein